MLLNNFLHNSIPFFLFYVSSEKARRTQVSVVEFTILNKTVIMLLKNQCKMCHSYICSLLPYQLLLFQILSTGSELKKRNKKKMKEKEKKKERKERKKESCAHTSIIMSVSTVFCMM